MDKLTFIGSGPSYIKNSSHFVNLIQDLTLTETDLLVSFDVVSLLTNVPVDESIELFKSKLVPSGLPPDYPVLIEFCLKNTYFLWHKEFYEQKEGAAMGSPLSPVISNLFMEHFEQEAIDRAKYKPTCWFRYVDDTFVIWPHGKDLLDDFLEHLNSLHPNICFTMEMELNQRLPFLDVEIYRKPNGTLGHAVHRKKTHTNRYLHANSHHHPSQKMSLINTLFHRADNISDSASKNLEKINVITALKQNGYKNKQIFSKKSRKARHLLKTNH